MWPPLGGRGSSSTVPRSGWVLRAWAAWGFPASVLAEEDRLRTTRGELPKIDSAEAPWRAERSLREEVETAAGPGGGSVFSRLTNRINPEAPRQSLPEPVPEPFGIRSSNLSSSLAFLNLESGAPPGKYFPKSFLSLARRSSVQIGRVLLMLRRVLLRNGIPRLSRHRVHGQEFFQRGQRRGMEHPIVEGEVFVDLDDLECHPR